MDVVTELLETAPWGICTSHDLAVAGFSRREVENLVADGTLARVRRGAYTRPTSAPEHAYLAEVHAALVERPDAVLTGAAALVVLGLPLLFVPSTIHVATRRRGGSGRRSRLTPVAVNPAGRPTVTDGIATAGPAAAILDTARLESLATAVAAADAALARGLVSRDDLAGALTGLGPVRGLGRARTCVELATPESGSPGESWSAVVLHRHGIPRPRRQAPFRDDDGFVGRVDFWWDDARVVGEFDGKVKYGRANPSHRPPEDVLWDEKRREDRLRAIGESVVRWTTDDLYRPTRLIRAVTAALRP